MSHIANILKDGGVVILPTETVYGIACRADNAAAIARIYDMKGRGFDKPFAVCVKNLAQAQNLAEFSQTALSLAAQFWPGPLSLVLPAKGKTLNAHCYHRETIALRCPDINWRETLLDTPLALTSANRSGEPASIDLPVDGSINDGPVENNVPSTMLKVQDDEITLLREGALDAAALAAYDVELS